MGKYDIIVADSCRESAILSAAKDMPKSQTISAILSVVKDVSKDTPKGMKTGLSNRKFWNGRL